MTFLEGFAQGFTAERNRRLEDEKDTRQLKLKFAFDNISEERKARQEAAAKSKEVANQAKSLAYQLKHPEAAPQIADLIQNSKLTSEQILKMYQGENENWVPQTTIKVPNAVSTPETKSYLDGYDEETQNEVKKILRPEDYTYTETLPDIVPNVDGPLKFGKNEELKVGNLPTLLKQLDDAKSTGNIEKVTQLKKDISYLTAAQAISNPKAPDETMILESRGKGQPPVFKTVRRQMVDGEEKLVDSNGQVVTSSNFQVMNDQQIKEYLGVEDKYRKDIDPIVQKQSALVQSLQAATELNKILADNPQALSITSEIAKGAVSLSKEYDAFQKIFINPQDQEQIANLTANPELVSSKIAETENFIKGVQQKVVTSVVEKQAKDSMLSQAYRSMLIYNTAAAYGQKGNAVGAADLKLITEMLGGTDRDTINSALGNVLGNIQSGIDAQASSLTTIMKNDSAFRNGYIPWTGFEIPRTYDIIDAMVKDEKLSVTDANAMKELVKYSVGKRRPDEQSAVETLNSQESPKVPTEKPKEVQGQVIPERAIKALLENPERRDEFESKYGKGTAGLYLRSK